MIDYSCHLFGYVSLVTIVIIINITFVIRKLYLYESTNTEIIKLLST